MQSVCLTDQLAITAERGFVALRCFQGRIQKFVLGGHIVTEDDEGRRRKR